MNDKDLEIQDLALEVMDMLAVALHFAGVKDSKIKEAIDTYLEEVDKIDDDKTYGQKEIINIIDSMKAKHKALFI